MNDIERRMIDMYRRIDPKDLRDAEFIMSEQTMDMLTPQFPERIPATAFGLSIRIDNNMPLGIVNLNAENSYDRAIRRAAKAGLTVNITKLTFPEPILPPAPDPTLRALLRHWTRKVFKR